MNTQNFSAETIHQAVEAIRNYQNDFDSIRENSSVTSVEEMAQIMIMQKFGEAQIEAEDIVKDIKKALLSLTSSLLPMQKLTIQV